MVLRAHFQLRCFLGLLCLIYTFASWAAFAQTKKSPPKETRTTTAEEPPLRVATQLVNVLFSVTDKQNHLITDLTQEEVEVLEEGTPQSIFTFKREVDLPLTVALLIDISSSVRPVLPQLQAASLRFLETTIHPTKDTASIITFNDEGTLIQGLTTNKERLRAGLKEVTKPLAESTAGISFSGGTSIFDTVYAACHELLPGEAGRKTIILFTDGIDTTSKLNLREAVAEALRAEVVIYAIGIGDAGRGSVDGRTLNQLCQETGGRAFIPKRVEDLTEAFTQLEQDLRQRYLLAYEPATEATAKGFRRIEVRVNHRKGVRIYHRRGYFTAPPTNR